LGTVCGVVHALYTAGHAPLGGGQLVRVDLCSEGLRLARLLHDLLPDEPMPAAVLALILLTEARRPARVDADGQVVLLADHDRSRWDRAMIAEAAGLLDTSLRRTGGIADPYQLQAAIALAHDNAPSYADTDWAEVLRLYDLLVSVAPSQPAQLARAVAVSEVSGAAAGLAALADLPHSTRVAAVRADLLASLGRYAEAVAETDLSLLGEMTAPERAHRRRNRSRWLDLMAAGSGVPRSAGG
jgi:RNA polymerase sigma-70 factor (ECF subfamily)